MNHAWNPIARGIVCAAIVLFCTSMVRGQCMQGSGRPDDPFQIATPEQLALVGSEVGYSKRHYVLVASIDLSGAVRSSPVIPHFSGSLDGRGYAIRGLTARGPGSQGLFGRIEEGGRVVNLQLEDVSLAGTDIVGGLAAVNAGAVSNCHIVGRVAGTGRDMGAIPGGNGDVGGLIGVNTGTITDCSSAAFVSGIKYVGGLVGVNKGTVTGSSSAADVSGNEGVGGLAGCNPGGALRNCGSTSLVSGNLHIGGLAGVNKGSISASYSDSDVIGERALGGLVGSNGGVVSICYSAGSVIGKSNVGGLAGVSETGLFSCYSIATVTADATADKRYVGGLVGEGGYGAACRNCYFLAPADGGGPDNKAGTPLRAAQMKQRSSFPSWDFWGTAVDGDADSWFMPADGFPVLSWQTEVTGLQAVPDVAGLSLDQARTALAAAGFVPGTLSYDFHRTLASDVVIRAYPWWGAGTGEAIDLVLSSGKAYDWTDNSGDGTAENPYQIETAGQLESLIDHAELWDKHFILIADLDMGGRNYPRGVIAWDGPRAAPFGGTFAGTFDGRDHTIRNLSILGNGSYDRASLFARVGSSGRVSNLRLLNACVTGARNTSFIASYNYGTLINCSVVGGIASSTSWNGLVTWNDGQIVDCYVDGVLVVGPAEGK